MPETVKHSARPQHEAVHRLHALLHTMRVIQQHEDQFCTLMHAIQTAGKLTAADRRELHKLLDQMPGESLVHDLDAVRAVLEPAPARTPAKGAPVASDHAH